MSLRRSVNLDFLTKDFISKRYFHNINMSKYTTLENMQVLLEQIYLPDSIFCFRITKSDIFAKCVLSKNVYKFNHNCFL